MTLRFAKSPGRFRLERLELPLLAGALCCVAGIASCVSEDDGLAPAPPTMDAGEAGGGDARAADAKVADAPSADRTVGDAASPPDAHDGGALVAEAGDGSLVTTAQSTDGGQEGAPAANFSASSVDFGRIACGASSVQTVTVRNGGSAALDLSATTTGSSFALTSSTPSTLTIPPGEGGKFSITATIPTGATAALSALGSLNVFTNDPTNANVSIRLSATPIGGTLGLQQAAQASVVFPTTKVGTPAAPIDVSFLNFGNAPLTIGGITNPNDPAFSVTPPPDGGIEIGPGQAWTTAVRFTPALTPVDGGSPKADTASFNLTLSGEMCGPAALSPIMLSGQATNATLVGFPSNSPPAIDFGAANCGGIPPPEQSILLVNTGTVPATITGSITPSVATDRPFTSNLTTPTPRTVVIQPGASFTVQVVAPAFPAQTGSGAMPPAILSTLTITSPDATPTSTAITLSEEPSGAVLSLTPAAFGTFPTGAVLLAQPPQSQAFAVVNSGTATATGNVTLTVVTEEDAGTDSAPPSFGVSTPTFPLQASQAETLSFVPVVAGPNQATLVIGLDPPSSPLCAPLPRSVPLLGTGIGAGPNVSPTSLTFDVPCDGTTVPPTQSFIISNLIASGATLDMNWSLGAPTGPGAANYQIVSMTKPPGLLHPGESSTVTVGVVGPIASASIGDGGTADSGVPVAAPTPAALAAQMSITTDVPYFNPVVALNEIPVGDQLSLSVGNLGLGHVPVGSTAKQGFSLTNNANAATGYQGANVSLVVEGNGASAYSIGAVPMLAAGGVAPASATFQPAAAVGYPATVRLATSDPLCAPLPPPIVLSGTGTEGQPAVLPMTLSFGTDPNDATGQVNCGATGPSKTFTVANLGNQPLTITGMTFASTKAFPGTHYSVSDSTGATLPQTLAITLGVASDPVTFTVVPAAIPSNADPNDANLFQDQLAIQTDATNSTLAPISLVMQARGAIIAFPTPLAPSPWDFGTVGFGSIGTLPNPVSNTGTASAVVALTGTAQPNVFGLAGGPTVLAPAKVTSLVGQFVPPAPDGTWMDQGTLTLTAPQAFCSGPPNGWTASATSPATWTGPSIVLHGASDSSPPVVASGSLAFGASECGGAPPAPQGNGQGVITLANQSNQALPFMASLQVGAHYTVTVDTDAGLSAGDGGTALLPAKGIAMITVTPLAVVPGAGVLPGSAPYADSLLVSVGNSSPPVWSSTFPISWTLDGAVLSLRRGAGDHGFNGLPFYAADSTTGFTLPITNSGNEAASVNFLIPPSANFMALPAPPVGVPPGPDALPQLWATSAAPSCLTQGGPNTTMTILPSGPVCQPLAVTKVNVLACSGSLSP